MWKCRVTLFLFTWGWRWAIDVVVAGCWRIDGAGVHCAHCGGSTVAPGQGLGGVKVQAPGSFHDESAGLDIPCLACCLHHPHPHPYHRSQWPIPACEGDAARGEPWAGAPAPTPAPKPSRISRRCTSPSSDTRLRTTTTSNSRTLAAAVSSQTMEISYSTAIAQPDHRLQSRPVAGLIVGGPRAA